MDSKGKSHEVEVVPTPTPIVEVEAIPTPAQIAVRKKDKKPKNRKESGQDEMTALNKKICPLGNSLNELTESGRELEKDPREISSTEKETPEAEEYVCLFESKDSDMKHSHTVFVKGFDCSFPLAVIKRTLKKHFRSIGGVTGVFVPYECKTGTPLGHGFINMAEYPQKALALNGSSLGGMSLEVTMARDRPEFYGYRDFRGCERCRNALMKHRLKRFHESFSRRFPLPGAVLRTERVFKQNEDANSL